MDNTLNKVKNYVVADSDSANVVKLLEEYRRSGFIYRPLTISYEKNSERIY